MLKWKWKRSRKQDGQIDLSVVERANSAVESACIVIERANGAVKSAYSYIQWVTIHQGNDSY